MQKQLLEQVQKALQAQQETIDRQNRMLDERDRDIAQLTASLNRLALTKTQELERLPRLFNTLNESIETYTREWVTWKNHRKTHVQTQIIITEQLLALVNAENQLAETLRGYQRALIPPDKLTSDTEQLESKLSGIQKWQNEIDSAQNEIDSAQNEISRSQQLIQRELDTLSASTSK